MESKKTQKELVRLKLERDGRVSRNWALSQYISRLSAIMYQLIHNDHLPIEGQWVGRDYIYTLKEQHEVHKSA